MRKLFDKSYDLFLGIVWKIAWAVAERANRYEEPRPKVSK